MKKLFKKSLAVIMVIVMTLTAAPLNGFVGLDLPGLLDFKVEASEYYTSGYYSYYVYDGKATIDRCDQSISGDVVIPSTLGGYTVTEINSFAFFGCTNITGVTIPTSVTAIGVNAFRNCISLANITIPDSVTLIGDDAFLGCKSLANITIPDSVTKIGTQAFRGCEGLVSVTIGSGVVTIGSGAFWQCSSLKTIKIPESVESIGTNPHPFVLCNSLESITVDPDNKNYTSDSYGVLFYKDKTQLMCCPCNADITNYVIPDSVVYIRPNAFTLCGNITSVVIPDGVEGIGGSAFAQCCNLKNVILPDSVYSIGDMAFAVCENLEYVHIPATVSESYIWDDILEDTSAYICSVTSDCYAKTYADENSIEFRVCTGHGGHTPTDSDEPVNPDNPSDEWEESTPEINKPTTNKINFGDTLVLQLEEIEIPEGYAVKWFVEGTGVSTWVSEDGLECRITSIANGNATIYAKLVDADENVVTNADGEEIFDKITVNSKAGFWQKFVSFFKNLFGINRVIY